MGIFIWGMLGHWKSNIRTSSDLRESYFDMRDKYKVINKPPENLLAYYSLCKFKRSIYLFLWEVNEEIITLTDVS